MSQPTTVTADHLRRLACLYVRQSSLQQVHDHRESTARQYDLKRRAQALGWSTDRIVVIDDDLGLSGASSSARTGFQRLVADVGLSRVGIVMGTRGLAARAQFERLASPVGDLRPERDAHSR